MAIAHLDSVTEEQLMAPTIWFKNSVSNAGTATDDLRRAQPRPSDLDPVRGLAVAVPVGLACWGLFGWLLWHLL
jgi:hypothetical protein